MPFQKGHTKLRTPKQVEKEFKAPDLDGSISIVRVVGYIPDKDANLLKSLPNGISYNLRQAVKEYLERHLS